MGQNDHNFRSDRWIALKFLHEFLEAIFLGVFLESHLGDEEVSSAKLSIQPLDHPQSFARVSGGSFPWGFYVMATR